MHRFLERQLSAATHVPTSARHHWRLIITRTLLVAIAITLVVLLGVMLEGKIPAIENWVQAQGAWMPLVFCLIFLIASLVCLPADLFVFIAGTLFGLWWGLLIAVGVEYVAMVIQFYLARKVFKNKIENYTSRHPRFMAIDRAVSKQGLRIGFLLRLGPVPFSPLSYVLGLSQISLRTYMLASIGMLPGIVPVVYYGVVARHLTRFATGMENHSWLHYGLMLVSVVVMVAVTVYIARVAHRALKEVNAL